ncbi:MAG TPA: hypothetical protein VFQ45_13660 [Longimicrobium sp.]|nr:hypothetical protein [Longimicrobium sp.]
MGSVRFETAASVPSSAPERADIALFVGWVARRPLAWADAPPFGRPPFTPVPAPVRRWLRERGWLDAAQAGEDGRGLPLLGLPVPVDSWDVFHQLFAWERRRLATGEEGATYLGAAVRSFFSQGGRRCYVVALGEPWTYGAERRERLPRLEEALPGWGGGRPSLPTERDTWRGIGHLYGLPDVSFLALPDLADAVAGEPEPVAPIAPPPVPREEFRECSAGDPAPVRSLEVRTLRAPRCDAEGYHAWAGAVRHAAHLLRARAREVQLVAALPIPADGVTVPDDPEAVYVRPPADPFDDGFDPGTADAPDARAADALLRFLTASDWLRDSLGDSGESIASAFVQVAYPWLVTPGSARLPEGLEGPEGALVGMLARNALLRGTFRSAASLDAGDVTAVFPVVDRGQLDRDLRDGARRNGLLRSGPQRSLGQRITLFGPTPRGVRLLSDVTTSRDEAWRFAGVCRLVASIVRAARVLGEGSVFEGNGERLWASVERRLGSLLLGLLRDGALRGASPEEAFEVRCDRTTMTQNDLDEGRVVARVVLQPSAPVERIVVVLAVNDGGRAAVPSAPGREAA